MNIIESSYTTLQQRTNRQKTVIENKWLGYANDRARWLQKTGQLLLMENSALFHEDPNHYNYVKEIVAVSLNNGTNNKL